MAQFKTKKGTTLPLIKVQGNADYMQVAHRLIWFREEHPDWGIQSEVLSDDGTSACVRVSVSNEEGRVIADGFKKETKSQFPDYLEKAQTGALGRALASCGFGTQFAQLEFDTQNRLADAPLQGAPKVKAQVKQVLPANPGAIDLNDWQNYQITFGKYKGKKLSEAARDRNWKSYIEFLSKKDFRSKPVEDLLSMNVMLEANTGKQQKYNELSLS